MLMLMMSMLKKYVKDERGAEIVEWVVVVAILAAVAVTAFGPGGVLATAISDAITGISTQIKNAS